LFNIDFEPVGRRGQCPSEKSILECAHEQNVDIVSICGGFGVCGQCKIQVVSGEVSELTEQEIAQLTEQEIKQNYRLACQCHPKSNVKIYIPSESLTAPQRTQIEGLELNVEPDPLVKGFDVRMDPPSLEIPEPDDRNIWNALEEQHSIPRGIIDLDVQRALSVNVRDLNWNVSVALRGEEIVAVGAPSTRWLGLAVDVGTTKIAAYLMDLESGETLAKQGIMNPQISYGEDVVARIFAAGKSPENAAKLQNLVVDALNETVQSLCSQIGADTSDIVDAVVVGNTAIHHLLLRLPVQQLGVSPYVPAVQSALDVKARDLGLKIAAGGYVHFLPNIAGYVGADHVAVLLATDLAEAQDAVLAIDIGTNTEICLNYKGRMTSVSCASGPAFEGAHIKFGMRAAPGAIEHMRLSGTKLDIQTIGGEPPVGICGSGLLDAVAQFRLNDVLDATGRMVEHPLVRNHSGMREVVLVDRPGRDPITISQKDVRELQLAKAAIRLGIRALVESEEIADDAIERVLLAGAFGTFIDVESAMTIGMFPSLPRERFVQVGNAAGTGARQALISRTRRLEAQQIAVRDRYIELAGIPDFNRKFADANSMSSSAARSRQYEKTH